MAATAGQARGRPRGCGGDSSSTRRRGRHRSGGGPALPEPRLHGARRIMRRPASGGPVASHKTARRARSTGKQRRPRALGHVVGVGGRISAWPSERTRSGGAAMGRLARQSREQHQRGVQCAAGSAINERTPAPEPLGPVSDDRSAGRRAQRPRSSRCGRGRKPRSRPGAPLRELRSQPSRRPPATWARSAAQRPPAARALGARPRTPTRSTAARRSSSAAPRGGELRVPLSRGPPKRRPAPPRISAWRCAERPR